MAQEGLARFIDRFTVEFVRLFPHPIERVWRALTDSDELSQWCMPTTIDLRVGGAYTFQGEEWGQILALDPPRLIRFGKKGVGVPAASDENYMQYELEPVAEGTRMRFVEHWQAGPDYRSWLISRFGQAGDDLPGGPDSPFHPGTLAGWHGMFEDLGDLMDGASRPAHPGQSRWRALIEVYRPHIKAVLPPAEAH
jgi:uncharacterized protein YndB with AHSA1/START domain